MNSRTPHCAATKIPYRNAVAQRKINKKDCFYKKSKNTYKKLPGYLPRDMLQTVNNFEYESFHYQHGINKEHGKAQTYDNCMKRKIRKNHESKVR